MGYTTMFLQLLGFSDWHQKLSTACSAGHRGRHALDCHGLHHHVPAAAGLQRLADPGDLSGAPGLKLLRAMQGIVGGMPWIAMGYITMFLQLLGFSDWLILVT